MIAAPPVPKRRLAGVLSADSRPDLLVHALAQLPEDVTLDLHGGGPELERVMLLARAYGVAERVRARAEEPSEELLLRPGVHVSFGELLESLWRPEDEPAYLQIDTRPLAGQRVAVMTNLPAPYRLPLFTRLERRLTEAGASFRVFFLSRRASGRSWMLPGPDPAFGHVFLASAELPLGDRRCLRVPADLEWRLRAYGPTIVVTAGLSPAITGRALLAGRRRGAVVGLWSGETLAMPTAGSRLRHLVRRRVVDAAHFAIAYGYDAGEYLRALRPELPLVYGRNTSEATAAPRPAESEVVRILAVADLASARKGIDVLIDALALAPSLPCRLTVVGDGDLRPALEERARGDGRIRFLGALPAVETKKEYARADVFAFPTRSDVFGLALVEAMGAGLAVVTSQAAGAVADLAASGTNSLVVGSHRPEEWAAALERLALDTGLRLALGTAAVRTIRRRWTIEHSCDSFLAGLRLGLLASGRVTA